LGKPGKTGDLPIDVPERAYIWKGTQFQIVPLQSVATARAEQYE
jgi:hypothetical protein